MDSKIINKKKKNQFLNILKYLFYWLHKETLNHCYWFEILCTKILINILSDSSLTCRFIVTCIIMMESEIIFETAPITSLCGV